jgi:hypothetical protein
MNRLGSLIATSALLAGALSVAGCGSSTTTRHGAPHVVIVPRFGTMSQLRRDRVSAVIDVGGAPEAPDWQAQATDAIWVANAAKETIQRIDPKTNRVTDARVTIKQPCAGLVVAFASVWSEDCDQNELVRVDERSGRELARIPIIPADSEGLATATQTAVYVVGKDASSVHYFVAKVNPTTNKIVRKIPVAAASVAAAAGFGSVWVTNPFLGTVTRIDAASDRVIGTTKTRKGARFLATGEGAVWVLNQSDGSVSKLDPGSGNVVAIDPRERTRRRRHHRDRARKCVGVDAGHAGPADRPEIEQGHRTVDRRRRRHRCRFRLGLARERRLRHRLANQALAARLKLTT